MDPDAVVRLLSAALWELPALPRAVCRDHWSGFDDRLPGESREQRAERLDAAVALCRRCPELAVCEQLPLPRGGVGVMAGRVLVTLGPG